MGKRLCGTSVASALACLCLASLPSLASASPAPFSEAEAKQQLRQAERAKSASMPADLTVALRDLALALPKLDGAAQRRARSILARPSDGSGPADEARWPSNANEKLVEAPTFVVHYAEVPGCDASDTGSNCDEPNLADEDSNDIPDYVDATVAAVNESIAVENGELGWPLPKGDGKQGEPSGSSQADRLDVYLADLCDESDFDPCLFGYASPDDSSPECNDAPYLCSAHLVLDNDYASDEFRDASGELGLRVTTAHEYNHALQFNLDSNQDAWMLESTATWSEEKVFPDGDDWIRSYMDSWAQRPQVSITKRRPRFYGSAVWNHWLENGDNSYGPHVVLNAWQSSRDVTPTDYAVGAYDDAIKDEGGGGFPQEFAAFTAATSEWKSGDGNFPDASELPDVTRQGKIRLGDKSKKEVLDNTSYALFEVNPRDADSITLKGRSGGGVRWSVALVGRTGDRVTGTVDRVVGYSEGGERRSVTLADAPSYDRITAVVTNADGQVSGAKSAFDEFNYIRNGEVFRLKVR